MGALAETGQKVSVSRPHVRGGEPIVGSGGTGANESSPRT